MTTIPRFDGAVAWARLTPEQRDEFGVLMLELIAGWHAQRAHGAHGALGRAASDAVDHLLEEVAQLFALGLDRSMWEPDGIAAIPSMTGPLCNTCGANAPCMACRYLVSIGRTWPMEQVPA